MAHGRTVEPKALAFSKKLSSKAIYIVQVYFLGEATIARALTSTVVRRKALRKGPLL